jgi:hypothetical protein
MVPAFGQRGFEAIPLGEKEASDRENRVSSPFGYFRRVGKEGQYELVEIQLAPYGEPAFRINFSIVPKEGIDTQFGHFPQDKVLLGWQNVHWNLYHNPRRWKWFKVRRWPWQPKATEEDQIELVKSVINLIPEIEQVFQGGRPGPHVRTVDMRR